MSKFKSKTDKVLKCVDQATLDKTHRNIMNSFAKEEDELKLAAESATAKLIDATKAGDESSELLKVSKEADKKLKKFDPEKISLLRVEVQELEKEIDDLDNRIATMEK